MTLLWIGAYTENMGGFSKGIASVKLEPKGIFFDSMGALTQSPSYLAHSHTPGVIYAVDEGSGKVEAFQRKGKSSSLASLGSQPTTGTLPCHLAATAQWLYVSNYGTGQVDVYPLDQGGKIGPVHQTLSSTGKGPRPEQEGPHAHSTLAFGDTALVADLGTDRVNVYRWHETKLEAESSLELPPGTGPRDFAVSPVAGKIYLLGELDGSVFVLGGGRNLQIMKAAKVGAAPGDHAAGLVVDPTGRFLFTGLRGSNRVVSIDANSLEVISALPSGGDTPRGMCVVGNLLLVANQKSGTISAFQIDQQTGALVMVGTPLLIDSPTCILPDFS